MVYSFFLLVVAYDGSLFFGWASQPNVFTVQGYIESVLGNIFKKQQVVIKTFSRLDKGVHAINQKLFLQLSVNLDSERLFLVLKKALKLVLLKKVTKINNDFKSLKNAAHKEYRYYINTGKFNV